MADNAESPHTSPSEEKNEGKKEEGLEGILGNVWKEVRDFASGAFKIGAVAAMPFAFNYLDPSHLARAQVYTYTLSAGKATANLIQKKPALEGFLKEGAIAMPLSLGIAEAFKGLNGLETAVAKNYGSFAGTAAKGAGLALGIQPAFVTAHTALEYGLGKKFRENLWPGIKTVFKYLALPSVLNVTVLYKFGLFTQMVVSSALSFAFGLMQSLRGGEGSVKNLYDAINPFSYVSSTFSVTAKTVRNTYSFAADGAYGLGALISDLFSGSPSSAPAPHAPPAQAQEAPNPAEHHEAHYMKSPSKTNSKYLPFPSENNKQYKKAA